MNSDLLKIERFFQIRISPFDSIDKRFNVDPQIQKQIKYASIVVCSNRPANNSGMSIEEIRFAINIGKPVVAVKITDNTSRYIAELGIPVIAKRSCYI